MKTNLIKTTLVALMLLISQSSFGQTPPCTNAITATGNVGVFTSSAVVSSLLFDDIILEHGQTLTISGAITFGDFFNPTKTIYMGENASIEFLPGSELTLENINIKACPNNTVPWNQILVNDSTKKLTAIQCKIEDAEIGLHSTNHGDFETHNVNFHNNTTHIKVDNSQGPSHPAIISSCIFNNDGSGIAGTTNICIDIDDVSDIKIGVPLSQHDPGSFDDADFGIDTKNSSATIINSYFGYYPLTSSSNMLAINAFGANNGTSTNSFGTIRVGGPLNTGFPFPEYQNKFLNCIGIVCEKGMEVHIEGNIFDLDNNSAIDIIKCGDVEISSNEITNFSGHGIYIKQIKNAEAIIKENNILVGAQGISIFGGGHSNTTPKIADIIITENIISSINRGIFVRAVKRASTFDPPSPLIYNNTITLDTSISATEGIFIDHCISAYIKENSLTNPNPASATGFITGIKIFDSQNTTAAQNTITNFDKGISVHDNMTGTKIKCNTFNNCYDGAYFNGTIPSTLVIECNPGESSNNVFNSTLGTDVVNANNSIGSPTIEWNYDSTLPTTSGNVQPGGPMLACSTCGSYARIGSSNKALNSFTIYPNPTTNYINIDLEQYDLAELEIYSLLGAKLLSKQVYNGNNQLDLEALPAGVYYCKLYSNKQLIGQEKLIISK